MQVRNPWGKSFYKGPWSVNSELWNEKATENERKDIKVDQKDGIFWTDAQTYKDYFEGTTINYNVEAW